MRGTGRPLGKPFFPHCQRRHPELLTIPTYLPTCEPPGDLGGGRGYVATLPTSGILLILPPALKLRGSPRQRDYVANMPTSGPLLILPPALKRWGSPRRRGLRSHLAHKWATSHSAPLALNRWGSPRRQGLRSHLAHEWATSDSNPRSEAVGLPKATGVTSPPCPQVGHFRFCPPLRSGRDPRGGGGCVATLHTSGAPLGLNAALKRWGSPRRHGLRSHLANKWATSDCAPRSEAVGIPEAARVAHPPCPHYCSAAPVVHACACIVHAPPFSIFDKKAKKGKKHQNKYRAKQTFRGGGGGGTQLPTAHAHRAQRAHQ